MSNKDSNLPCDLIPNQSSIICTGHYVGRMMLWREPCGSNGACGREPCESDAALALPWLLLWSLALMGKETLCSCIWILYFSLCWPRVMNKTKNKHHRTRLSSIVFPRLSLVGKLPGLFPRCLSYEVGPGSTICLLPLSIQVLGDLSPSPRVVLWAWLSHYNWPL